MLMEDRYWRRGLLHVAAALLIAALVAERGGRRIQHAARASEEA